MLRNRQWIGNFIALFILLTGMCVDEVKADSVFLRPQTTAVVVNLERTDAVISDVDIEPAQLLCTRNSVTGSQVAAQITSTRRTIKLSMLLLCVAVFSLLLSNFYTVERIAEFPCSSERAAVIHYIHNTDGKK